MNDLISREDLEEKIRVLQESEQRLKTVVENLNGSLAARARSEIQYRRLFEAAQDGIFILDEASGRIVDVNPFLVDLLCLKSRFSRIKEARLYPL
jgi:PAS domain-containing protein